MTQKFNSKTYQGKKRIYRPVAGVTLISRVLVWDAKRSEYREPPRGTNYLARRVEYFDGERKLVAQSFDTLEAAKNWQMRVVDDVKNEPAVASQTVLKTQLISTRKSVKNTALEGGGPLFCEVVDQWKRRTFSRLSKGTQVNYEKYLRLHFSEVMKRPIESITPAFVDRWIDERKRLVDCYGRGCQRKSFEHELTLLSSILRYYIEYNDDTKYVHPIKRRHREAVKVARDSANKASQDITRAEFERFRDQLSRALHGSLLACMATVQFYQALRISEVAALRWEDVTLDWQEPQKSRLTVRQHVVYLRRKETPDFIEQGFKNASSDEPVKEQPMFPDTFEALRKCHSGGTTGLIFKNPDGTFFSYRQIQAAYDRAFREANLPYRGTHVLRHGGTRHVYNETGDLSIAQQLLGNSDFETTLVYARRHKGALTKLAESHWSRRSETEASEVKVPQLDGVMEVSQGL